MSDGATSLDEAIHAQVVAIQTMLHDLPPLLVARAHQVIAEDQDTLVRRFEHAARALQDAVDGSKGDQEALAKLVGKMRDELAEAKEHLLMEIPPGDKRDLIGYFYTLTQDVAALKTDVEALKSREAGNA